MAALTISEQVSSAIAELSSCMLSQHPRMPQLLSEISKTLKANPDCVTLLAEEEIAVIVSGLKQQTKTEIVTAAPKTRTKSLKSITEDDL